MVFICASKGAGSRSSADKKGFMQKGGNEEVKQEGREREPSSSHYCSPETNALGMPCQRVSAGSFSPFINKDRLLSVAPEPITES